MTEAYTMTPEEKAARDMFAAAALQAIIASQRSGANHAVAAAEAFAFADAMIAARRQPWKTR